MSIHYHKNIDGVDWHQMKAILAKDDFDNGRTPAQLHRSFANSFATCIAYDGEKLIGTARALSDGICNAYVVDVWTYTPYRRQGIGRQMMRQLLAQLEGQHVYLFTDDALPFYQALGFQKQGTGLGLVVGKWLQNGTVKE
jgi:ribosomal protein S18 acetylase RimI-like enzyme